MIAAWKCTLAPDPNKVVGHLPNETSRFTWFIQPMEQLLLYKSYLQNTAPLICGGLEIPIEVSVAMTKLQREQASFS